MSVYKHLLTPVLQSDTQHATRKSALPAGRRRAAVVVCKARTRLQRPTLHFTTPLLSSPLSSFPIVLAAIVSVSVRVRPRQINHDFGVKENGELRRADRRKIL